MFPEDFEEEMKVNDELVKVEREKNAVDRKTKLDEYKEFSQFIKKNDVKIKKGGKK